MIGHKRRKTDGIPEITYWTYLCHHDFCGVWLWQHKIARHRKTSKTLQLSVNQREVAHAKIQQIEKIVEDYELEKKRWNRS